MNDMAPYNNHTVNNPNFSFVQFLNFGDCMVPSDIITGLRGWFQYNSASGQDRPLYDDAILQRLNFNRVRGIFNPHITAVDPGDGLVVRAVRPSDYDKGLIDLLEQLTETGKPSRQQFLLKLEEMRRCPDTYYVTVIEDTYLGKIIGAATLFVEHKFIHNCAKRGHLEDVVVNNTYRGKQLGKLIVVTTSLLALELGCYKMSLECKDKLIPFYKSLGYQLEPGNGNAMCQRFAAMPS